MDVTITTDPPGPVYSVASYIIFNCNVAADSAVTYNWLLYCGGILTADVANPRIQVLSTSEFCFDTVVCSVRDSDGHEGNASAVIDVTGWQYTYTLINLHIYCVQTVPTRCLNNIKPCASTLDAMQCY